jgi:hypothetical protein
LDLTLSDKPGIRARADGLKGCGLLEQSAAPIEDQKRVLTIEAFSAWFADRITQVAGPTARSGP